MRHKFGYRKLNRTSEHRKALFKNMLNSLIKYEQITTTLPKAKELKPQIDKVITLGKKNNLQSKTNRGGKYTVHSPGQKVVYFVLNLNKRKKDIRMLINNIESCIINILREYKIKSYPDRNNIGIWIKKGDNSMKIAAIGIRVKKWIAYHGFALNISNDLKKYMIFSRSQNLRNIIFHDFS